MSQARFEQKRKEDRRRRLRRYVAPALGLLVVGGLVWLVLFSDVLAVKRVSVQGLDTLRGDAVREVAEVPRGRPLVRVDTVAVETRVSAMERVERVEVRRSWPSTITIELVERQPVAWVRSDGRIRAVDRFGVDYRTLRSEPDSLVEMRIPVLDARPRQQALAGAASIIDTLRQDAPELMEQVQHVEAESQDSVVLDLTEGRTVTWGSAGRTDAKLRVLGSLLEAVDASDYDVSAPEQPTTRE